MTANNRSGGGSHKTRKRLIVGGIALAIIIIILLLRSCGGDTTPDDITNNTTPTPEITEPATSDSADPEEKEYTITVKGDIRTEIIEGDEYVDPGIEIRDENGNLCPEMMSKVVIEGEVDTSKPGTYIITYKLGDKTAKRIVVVKSAESTEQPGDTDKPGTTNPPSGGNQGGEETTPSGKQHYDMSSVSFTNSEVTYDGKSHSIYISGNLPAGVRVTYEGNARVNAGTYSVTAHFYGDDNHEPIPDMKATLTIRKAYYDMSDVEFNDRTVKYDGQPHGIYVDEGTLPDGVRVRYTGNGKVNPGTYTVTAHFSGDTRNYHSIASMKATLIIWKESDEKPSYDMSQVSFKDATVTYDGCEHSIFITGKLPDGVTVTYSGNGRVNAGTYTVTAHFVGSADYNPIPDMTATLRINKASYDMSGVRFNNKTVTYNGRPHSIFITGKLPDGVTVHYEGNGKTAVGTYTVTAKFTGDSNHNSIPNMTATLTIQSKSGGDDDKPSYDMSGVTFDGKTVTYDGNVHSLAISGKLPNGVSVTYENNGKVDAGTYTVIAHFKGSSAYNPIPDMTATLRINKATYNMSGVSFNDKTVTYNGQPHSIFISGKLPAGVSVTYEGNGKTAVGTYTVTAKFTGDSNHNSISNMTATLTIQSQSSEKPSYDMSGVTFDDKTVTYDGNVHSLAIGGKALPAGVSVTYENNGKTNAGTYKVIAHFTGSPDYKPIPDMTATLIINKANYNMSGVSFNDQTVTFDGQPHSIFITGNLPAGVSVTYEGNDQTAVGTYTVTAKFTGDSNHNPISNMTATLTIQSQSSEKPSYDMSGVTFDDKTVTYDGNVHSLAIGGKALPAGVSVTYENNDKTNADTYTVIAHFTGSPDYKPIDDMTATLTINKADVNMSAISYPSSDSLRIKYDGNVHSYPQVTGSADGLISIKHEYHNTDPLQAIGDYSVTVTFEVDDNHNPIDPYEYTVTIYDGTPGGGDGEDSKGEGGGNTGGETGGTPGGETGEGSEGGGNTGGNTGGETGGTPGGETGEGSEGGGNTGGNTGGETGGTPGGETGESSEGKGEATGGSTGGETGGTPGGEAGEGSEGKGEATGGSTGGETGGTPGGETGEGSEGKGEATGGSTGGETGGIPGGETGESSEAKDEATGGSTGIPENSVLDAQPVIVPEKRREDEEHSIPVERVESEELPEGGEEDNPL